MALQLIKHGLPFPAWPTSISGPPSTAVASFTIDAASEKAALIFPVTAAKAIRKIHFRTGTVTTGDTVDVRVEAVDTATDGAPTGTLRTTDSNAALVVDGADDNVWKSVQLTADTAALSIGELVALVIVNGGGGGNIQIASYGDSTLYLPYGAHFTAAWAKSAVQPLIIPEYADGSFEPIFGYFDAGATNAVSFNSGSATNRRGNLFQLAFPARANGCWVWADADGEFTVKLYDSDGSSVLATTATVNTLQRQQTANPGVLFLPFLAPATLSKNTNYRLAIVPSTVTDLIGYYFDVPAAGVLDMFPGGQSCHMSVFTSSAWVETTTARSYLGLMLDAFDDGASAGGWRPRLRRIG